MFVYAQAPARGRVMLRLLTKHENISDATESKLFFTAWSHLIEYSFRIPKSQKLHLSPSCIIASPFQGCCTYFCTSFIYVSFQEANIVTFCKRIAVIETN